MASIQSQIVELLPKLRRFAYSLTGNISDGDDLLQNAIERALKRQETFDTEKRLESWMYAITKNIWIDELRSRSRRGISVDRPSWQPAYRSTRGFPLGGRSFASRRPTRGLPDNGHRDSGRPCPASAPTRRSERTAARVASRGV